MKYRFGLVCALVVILFGMSTNIRPARAQEEEAAATTMRWVRWPGTPDPNHRTLYSVKIQDLTHGWAVGEYGTILRWNGTQWSRVSTPVIDHFRSVDMVGNLAYAVGEFGTILRWDGTQWQIFESFPQTFFYSISMVSDSLGWAVGKWDSKIRLVVWNGLFWAIQEVPPDHLVYAIEMIDIDNGWCVGEGGVILHKILGDFFGWNSPTLNNLNGLTLTSTQTGFAVGDNGTILKLNTTWTVQNSPTAHHLRGVSAVANNNAWAVGDTGTMLQYDGVAWKNKFLGIAQTLYGVSLSSASNGWAVGSDGILLRYMDMPYKGFIPVVIRD